MAVAALLRKRPVYSGNKGLVNGLLSVAQAAIWSHLPPGGPTGSASGAAHAVGAQRPPGPLDRPWHHAALLRVSMGSF